MKRAAAFTEAEFRRAIKAAKALGYARVELIHPETGLRVVFEQKPHEDARPEQVGEDLR